MIGAKYILVKTTFEDRKEAEAIAKSLIKNKLIASGQLTDIHSLYTWDNQDV